MRRRQAVRIVAAVLGAALFLPTPVAVRSEWADDALEARQLVERSVLTLESFAADPNYQGSWRDLMKDAKGPRGPRRAASSTW